MAMKKKFLGLALAAAVALPATGVYADTIGGNKNDTLTHNVTVTGTVANKQGIAPEGKIEVELPTAMTFRVDQDGTFQGSDFRVENKSKVGIDVFVDEFRTNAGGNITVKKKEELEAQKTNLNRSNVYLELSGNVGGQKQTVDLAKVSELSREDEKKILNVSGGNSGLIQLQGGAGTSLDTDAGSNQGNPQGIDKDGASGDFTLIYKIKKEMYKEIF